MKMSLSILGDIVSYGLRQLIENMLISCLFHSQLIISLIVLFCDVYFNIMIWKETEQEGVFRELMSDEIHDVSDPTMKHQLTD